MPTVHIGSRPESVEAPPCTCFSSTCKEMQMAVRRLSTNSRSFYSCAGISQALVRKYRSMEPKKEPRKFQQELLLGRGGALPSLRLFILSCRPACTCGYCLGRAWASSCRAFTCWMACFALLDATHLSLFSRCSLDIDACSACRQYTAHRTGCA